MSRASSVFVLVLLWLGCGRPELVRPAPCSLDFEVNSPAASPVTSAVVSQGGEIVWLWCALETCELNVVDGQGARRWTAAALPLPAGAAPVSRRPTSLLVVGDVVYAAVSTETSLALAEAQVDGYGLGDGALVGAAQLGTSSEPLLAPVIAARSGGLSATLNFGVVTPTSPRARASLLDRALSVEGTVSLPPFRSLRLGDSGMVSFDGKTVRRLELSEPVSTADFEGGVVVLESGEVLRGFSTSRNGRLVVAMSQSGGLVANFDALAEEPLTSVAVDEAELATLVGFGFDGRVELMLTPKSAPERRREIASIPGAANPALAAFARHSFVVAFEEGGFARLRQYSCPELQ